MASAVVLACLLIALFAILLAAPLMFLLMHMGAACCAIAGPDPNEEVGTTVSVLLRSRGLGRSSVQSSDSESRRFAICIAGGESQGSTQATLELFLLPARAPRRKK
jgi:hypothetical protein